MTFSSTEQATHKETRAASMIYTGEWRFERILGSHHKNKHIAGKMLKRKEICVMDLEFPDLFVDEELLSILWLYELLIADKSSRF